MPRHSEQLTAGVENLVLGVPRNYFFDRLAPEVELAVRAAIEQLGG